MGNLVKILPNSFLNYLKTPADPNCVNTCEVLRTLSGFIT